MIYVGTSGYSYREWKGTFYPPELKPPELLAYYAQQFKTVELNNSFYHIPTITNLENWSAQVGPRFRFAVKANQAITHRIDFGMVSGAFARFVNVLATLGERLGPVLFQFPPQLGKPERALEFLGHLKAVMAAAPAPITPVVEFRHPALLQPEMLDRLREAQVALCCNDEYLPLPQWPDPWGIIYLRLRKGPYRKAELQKIAAWLKAKSKRKQDSYVFMKHEVVAPDMAAKLLTALKVPR